MDGRMDGWTRSSWYGGVDIHIYIGISLLLASLHSSLEGTGERRGSDFRIRLMRFLCVDVYNRSCRLSGVWCVEKDKGS